MLPNLIIIGAMKCATTSLHYYLGLHPQIVMSKKKELNFFIGEFSHWAKGSSWYESNFTNGRTSAQVYGEASPNYTRYPALGGVAERMHYVVPEARLIYVVRDPVERMISHFLHEYTRGDETRTIVEAFDDLRDNHYFDVSRYYMQLEQYFPYFPPSRILVITQEDLHVERQQTLRRVFEFLGVEASFYSRRFHLSYFRQKSSYKRRKSRVGLMLTRIVGTAQRGMLSHLPPGVRGKVGKVIYFPFSHRVERPALPAGLRRRIAGELKHDTDRLRSFAGCDFARWRV